MQTSICGSAPHPVTRDSVAYRLSDYWVALRRRGGPKSKLANLNLALEVLQDPHPHQVRESDSGYALIAKPKFMFRDASHVVPTPGSWIFVVLVDFGMTIGQCFFVDVVKRNGESSEEAEERVLSPYGRVIQNAA